MTNEQKRAVIEALNFYIPVAAPHKDDVHIELLEQVVAELKEQVPPTPTQDDLLDDTL